MYLKQLILDENVTIEYAETILLSSNVQLKFGSIETFNKSFGKFCSLLLDHTVKIKSLYAPVKGIIFEDTVKILSILEDNLEININHLVIDAEFHEDIKQLLDFYYDDLQDGSLTVAINVCPYDRTQVLKSPIEIIAYIERSKINGLTLCFDPELYSEWYRFQYLWESIIPYTSAIFGMYDEDYDDYIGFKGFIIN